MAKGTAAQGKKSAGKNFIRCRRCGRASYHIRKKTCSKCGYGKTSKLRKYTWQKKNKSKKK